jgi:hypothetical protein
VPCEWHGTQEAEHRADQDWEETQADLIRFQTVDVAINDWESLEASEEDKVYQAQEHGKVDDDGLKDEKLECLEDDEAAAVPGGQQSGWKYKGRVQLTEKSHLSTLLSDEVA